MLTLLAPLAQSAAHAQEPTASSEATQLPKRFVADCERQLPATAIDVVASPSEVKYDFAKGVAELTTRPTMFREGGAHTLGLTEATFRLDVAWKGDVLMDSQTRMGCTRPRVTVHLKVGPQQVFVAKEFPQSGCAFWEIAKHELRHVTANQEQAEKVAQTLQDQLRSSFGNRIFYGKPDELKSAFTETLENDWMPWAKDQFAQVEAVHQSIDTPEEYRRNATMCGGEVPRALKAAGIE
ncbi:hypothetical protein AS149_12425 [Burkholderia cenocepacia]|nr:hypothetical protein AS149_12425 [Burkholderia cenocepacia]